MEKPIITWDDLTKEEKENFDHEWYNFNGFSEIVQRELTEKGLLIQNPVENWDEEDFKSLSIDKLVIKGIQLILTSTPEPRERMIPVCWGKSFENSETVDLCIHIIADYKYRVPESLFKQVGAFVSDWNEARESSKLDGFEVKGE